MIDIKKAIFKLYPQVVAIRGDVATDADDNEVAYDLSAVNAKAMELQTAETAAEQAAKDVKQTALNKLMALGLTEAEALALGAK